MACVFNRTGRPLDGIHLLPYLVSAQSGRPDEQLFWRAGPKYAARVGDWKLVQQFMVPGKNRFRRNQGRMRLQIRPTHRLAPFGKFAALTILQPQLPAGLVERLLQNPVWALCFVVTSLLGT